MMAARLGFLLSKHVIFIFSGFTSAGLGGEGTGLSVATVRATAGLAFTAPMRWAVGSTSSGPLALGATEAGGMGDRVRIALHGGFRSRGLGGVGRGEGGLRRPRASDCG